MTLLLVHNIKTHIMNPLLKESFEKLRSYCESQDFAGWEPYDGLNSRVFQALPFFKRSASCRSAVVRKFRRSPVNFRRIAQVPKEHNATGIALFLSGYCNLYRAVQRGMKPEIPQDDCLERIRHLARLLLSLKSKGHGGSCWGDNFDRQVRHKPLFPKNTPTVDATSFAVAALCEAYEITGDKDYLDEALSAADFVTDALHEDACGVNASKILSTCYRYTKNEEYKLLARTSAEACCEAQNKDGSWADGLDTGYNLEALQVFQDLTGDHSFRKNISRGFDFYIRNFFLADGIPKYYEDRIYPVDIRCPGQLFVVLSKSGKYGDWQHLTRKVMRWTLKNMQDRDGYFYYQVRAHSTSRIPYMGWSNAFMFHGLSCFLLNGYRQ